MNRAPQVGDFASEHGQQVTQGVATAGTIGTGVAIALHATAVVPIIGAAVAGVVLALSLFFGRKGPQQKVATTHIVDDLETNPQFGLKAILAAYEAGPRTRSSQRASLQAVEAIMEFLRSSNGCGNSSYGDPGHACIADRERGGKLDWYRLYYDPIATDPRVTDDPVSNAVVDLFPTADPALVEAVKEYWLPVALVAAGLLL